MAVYLIAGKPGSGKSFEAVKEWAFPAFKAGRKVITNLPLNLDVWQMFFPHSDLSELLDVRPSDGLEFSRPDHYGDSWRHPGLPSGHPEAGSDHARSGKGPLYIVDEAHRDLPSGATDKAVIHWFKEHRHEGADVLLMTQEPRDIHRSILALVQAAYWCTNHAGAGYQDRYSVQVRQGWQKTASPMGASFVRRYDGKYFPLYQSYSRGGSPGAETKARTKPLHKRWFVKAAAVGLVLSVWQLWSSLSGLFGGAVSDVPAAVVAVQAPTTPQPTSATAGVPVAEYLAPDVLHRPAVVYQAPSSPSPPPPSHPFEGQSARLGASVEVIGAGSTQWVYLDGRRIDLEALEAFGYSVRRLGSGDLVLSHERGGPWLVAAGRIVFLR